MSAGESVCQFRFVEGLVRAWWMMGRTDEAAAAAPAEQVGEGRAERYWNIGSAPLPPPAPLPLLEDLDIMRVRY